MLGLALGLVVQLHQASVRIVRVALPTLLLAALLVAAPAGPASAQSGTPAAARPTPNQPITLNFKDADIDSVVGAFGHLLNRTFIIDPRVRGKVTLETPRAVSPEVAYQLLQSTLRLQGFTIVETGAVARVVPEADAKLQSGPVNAGRAPTAAGDQVVTQIFRLSYESASNLVPVLRPLISPNNTIVAYPNNNALVITDYAANLQRIGRIIATLDTPAAGEVDVVAMKHALAADVATQVSRLLDDQARGGAPGAAVDPGQRVMLIADTRINAILLRSASPARMNLAKALIGRLDQPSSEPGNIRVVYLRNAEATRLVQVLRGVLGGDGTGGAGGNQPGGQFGQQPGASGLGSPVAGLAGQPGGASSPANSALSQSSGTGAAVTTVSAGGAVIAADPSTNSLIITAAEPVYRNLRSVIDKLDARRVQVYIESLIVEVSADRAMELGVQWQFLSQPSGGSGVIGGTNLPPRGTGNNIIDATTNILGIGRGLNIGVVRAQPLIGGASADGNVSVGPINLGLLARALETEAGANILATPNLVTLDNEEARIIIGQNVPFITGSFTSTGAAGGAVNPFQTIERRDVGTTLRVRPQVAEGGTVRMQIFQEVSSVQDATLAAGLITNKRAIESNVLVDDGQVVVLGGLIEERTEGGVSMVPGLGRIPFLGGLFRYDNRKRVKTNLMVFLRPVVLRNAEASYGVTADRYDFIRQLQGDSRVTPHDLIPESQFRPPVMSPLPPRPGSPGVAPPSVAPSINDAMPERWRSVAPRPVAPAGTEAAPGNGSGGADAASPVRPGAPTPPPGSPGAEVAQPGARAPGPYPPVQAALSGNEGEGYSAVLQTAPNEIVIPRRLSVPAAPASR